MLIDPSSANIVISEKQKKYIDNFKKKNFFKFSELDPCFACGGIEFTVIANKDRYGFDLNYCICNKCSYLFANPYYTKDCLSEFYGKHYAHIYGRSGSERQVFEVGFVNAIQKILPMLRPYIPKVGSVMDFGCGYGGTLAAFPESWTRIGFDYDENQLSYGRKFDLDLRSIDTIESYDGEFDVIMLNQVLEHIPNPILLLKKLRRYLKPNGVLYIEVPGFEAIINKGIDLRLAFKNAHRHFFCLDSLSEIARYADLKMIKGDEGISSIYVKKESVCGDTLFRGKLQKSDFWVNSILKCKPSEPPKRAAIFLRAFNRAWKLMILSKLIIFFLKKKFKS